MFASKYEKNLPKRWVCTMSRCGKKAAVGILDIGDGLCAGHRRFPDPAPDRHLLACADTRRANVMSRLDAELFDHLFSYSVSGRSGCIRQTHGYEGADEEARILESMAYSMAYSEAAR